MNDAEEKKNPDKPAGSSERKLAEWIHVS